MEIKGCSHIPQGVHTSHRSSKRLRREEDEATTTGAAAEPISAGVSGTRDIRSDPRDLDLGDPGDLGAHSLHHCRAEGGDGSLKHAASHHHRHGTSSGKRLVFTQVWMAGMTMIEVLSKSGHLLTDVPRCPPTFPPTHICRQTPLPTPLTG